MAAPCVFILSGAGSRVVAIVCSRGAGLGASQGEGTLVPSFQSPAAIRFFLIRKTCCPCVSEAGERAKRAKSCE
jgi:hypothetical protein